MAFFKFLILVKMWPTSLLMLICSFPTGITVDRHGFIYFVDGTMIRRIDENAVITTVIGSNGLTSTQPLSCDSGMDISQVGATGSQALPLFGIMEMKNHFLIQKLGRKEAWGICYNTTWRKFLSLPVTFFPRQKTSVGKKWLHGMLA